MYFYRETRWKNTAPRYSRRRFKLRRKKGIAVSVQTQRVSRRICPPFVALIRIIPSARAVKKFFCLKMKSRTHIYTYPLSACRMVFDANLFTFSSPLSTGRFALRRVEGHFCDWGLILESRLWIDLHNFLSDNFQ